LETSKIVVAEAFSADRPVIVSKLDGPEELVRDGIGRFVVERNDSKFLAEATQKSVDDPKTDYRNAPPKPSTKDNLGIC